MPKVPTYDNFQAGTSSLPGARVEASPVRNVAGQQLQQTGQAAQQFGGAFASDAIDMQTQANQLRVDDALNKAKEAALTLTYDKDAGYTSQRGINALERASGKPLADEYADTLKEQFSSLSSGLGNDAQKQAFTMRSNDLLTQFHGQAIQHESKQFQEYALSVREGTITNRMNEIGLNYKDPQAVGDAVQSIQAATYDMARLQGKSAEWAEGQTRKMTSNAHTVAITAALQDRNIDYADGYLKKFAKQMDADDILKVRGHITREMDNRQGLAASTDVMGKAMPQIVTSEAERAFNIAVGTESNGKQFGKDGQPLTSPKGAIGIAQVMPATGPEAAKLAGLPWDEQRYKTDAGYNKAIGFAYFQQQLQANGGNLPYSYAAYNAGPGALQEAIKKADKSVALNKNDPTVQARGYLDFLPKETRDYVAKNMAAYGSGQGANPKPTFLDIDTALRADPRLAGNPQRYAIARADAEKRFAETTQAVKQRDEESVANAMRGVIENGGRFSDLPVSVRASLPPKEVDNVIGFAQKIAKGDDATNPRLYDRLANNPTQLAQLSDNAFFGLRRELNEADFKHFSNERAKLQGKTPGSSGPGDLNSQAIKQTLDTQLRVMGIDPTPKDDGGNDAARVGGIRQFVDQYFYVAQREAGKKFSDVEVAQHLNTLAAKNATYRGWLSNSSGPLLGMKASDLGGDIKDRIKAAYKRQGVDSPTDAQIMNIYWMQQANRK
jgi:soluble lytic murein transglycosylase